MSTQKARGRTQPLPLKKLAPLYRVEEFPSARIQEKSSSAHAAAISAIDARDVSAKLEACVDRAFRIPTFLSTTGTLDRKQEQFLNRLIVEIENALLFPRTLPESEQYPETVLTNIRRLVLSSYGLLAINFRRFLVEVLKTNAGEPPSAKPFWQGSPFVQIEPSMAFQFGLPILLVREKGTDVNNGIWQGGIAPLNVLVEWDSDNQTVEEFFSTVQWREVFANWTAEVRGNYFSRTEPSFRVPT